ncbi:2-isopropylmalate synthase [archaeon]|nr:2-isopropylmalate synthase [archaeon]
MSDQVLVSILDTTLRDGEQTRGVSFSLQEKLSIAKLLLKEVKVDRLEVASARVSLGELENVKAICEWAKSEGFLEKIEVLGFADKGKSVDWVLETGCKTINLLAKGSLNHCLNQLRKKPEEHFSEVEREIENAVSQGLTVNVYLEDWSSGMQNSPSYVFEFLKALSKAQVQRLMLTDTLGVLEPFSTKEFILRAGKFFPIEKLDFHTHNDYGLAVANSLSAVQTGIRCVHCTVNGLGERAGNAALAEVVAAVKDKTNFSCFVDEKSLVNVSRLVEQASGKRLPANKPIVGTDVFTQTAGVHADGDAKGKLYVSKLAPERFGRKREYALGKLSGKASLEQNLKELEIELTAEQKKAVLEEIVKLGDKKKAITPEDLPFIIADVLETPLERKFKILEFNSVTTLGKKSKASLKIKCNGVLAFEEADGDGGYDAFMKALSKIAKRLSFDLPELLDYEVRIPPGGKTDALVEATITWSFNGKEFRTIGVDSDQVMAAVKATEKMLNTLFRK